jgi:hypothetical protein
MDPQRWSKIESLYHAALAKNLGERSTYLDTACAQDPEPRREVESLLGLEQGVAFLIFPLLPFWQCLLSTS